MISLHKSVISGIFLKKFFFREVAKVNSSADKLADPEYDSLFSHVPLWSHYHKNVFILIKFTENSPINDEKLILIICSKKLTIQSFVVFH